MPDKSPDIEDVEFEQPSAEKVEEFMKEMGTDRETVDKEVAELKSWLAADPILPAVEDEKFLERFHAQCKFNIEKTRKKLEVYYRTRTFEPDMLLFRDPLDPAIVQAKNVAYHITLPELTPEGYRVSILRLFKPEAPELFDPEQTLKSGLMMLDSHMAEDFCKSHVVILDARGFSPQHLIRTSPTFLKKADVCSTKAFPHRYVNIHIVNVQPFMAATINIYKMLMGKKMESRILTHQNYESLHDYIPKPLLPKEYGGTNRWSLEELRDITYHHLIKKRDWFIKEQAICADLRTSKDSFQDIFGSKGTFKTIQID